VRKRSPGLAVADTRSENVKEWLSGLPRGLRRIGNVSLRVSRPHPISGANSIRRLGRPFVKAMRAKPVTRPIGTLRQSSTGGKRRAIRAVLACPRRRAARRGGRLRHGPELNWPALPLAGSRAGCAQNSGRSLERLVAAVAGRDDPPGREQARPLDPRVVPPAAARAITPRRGRLRARRHRAECSGRSFGGDRQASLDRRARAWRTPTRRASGRDRSRRSSPSAVPRPPALPCQLVGPSAAKGAVSAEAVV
jgi:hypothetical protein